MTARLSRVCATNLRDACIAAYSTVAEAPSPTPSPVIHHDGIVPTIDAGDLLIVQVTSITSAFQGPPELCAIVPQVNLTATVTRCVPNLTSFGRVADHERLSDGALGLADDASTLWEGVTAACRAGTLWAGFVDLSCADTTFRDARPGAGGGIGWFSWAVSVKVTAPLR